MVQYKPPLRIPPNDFVLFLAGTIDNGNSIDWQMEIVNGLESYPISIANPRTDDWDSSWTNESLPLMEQILWELKNIKEASIVFFNFLPDSKSPITLLELGLVAGLGVKAVVCCPVEYYRSANVYTTCRYFGIPVFHYRDAAITYLKSTM